MHLGEYMTAGVTEDNCASRGMTAGVTEDNCASRGMTAGVTEDNCASRGMTAGVSEDTWQLTAVIPFHRKQLVAVPERVLWPSAHTP